MRRTTKAEEAILLASPSERVRDYLVKRGEDATGFDPITAEVEAKLLERGDRLIDLTLAEYCLHGATARTLFNRDIDDWALRALVLTNKALEKGGHWPPFPDCLFDSREGTLAFLSNVKPDERNLLFMNPSLNERFLEDFLSLGDTWQAMAPEQRIWALGDLASNEKLQVDRSMEKYLDGDSWYAAGLPFAAAWLLIEKLEPDLVTARHLGSLLRDLPADCYQTENIEAALDRWRGDASDAEREVKDNEKSWLSPFQVVRQAGARLLSKSDKDTADRLLSSEDIAIRCGAYEGHPSLNKKTIKAAVAQDGDLARVYLIRNKWLWRNANLRDNLVEDVLRGSLGDEPRWEFRVQENLFRKKFPKWFEDEDRVAGEPNERPIADSSVADLVASIAGDGTIKRLEARMAEIEKTQRIGVWLLVITTTLLVLQACK